MKSHWLHENWNNRIGVKRLELSHRNFLAGDLTNCVELNLI